MIFLVTCKQHYKKNYVLHHRRGGEAPEKVLSFSSIVQVNFVSIFVLLERCDTSPLSIQPSSNQCNNSEPQTISSKVSESIERSILIWLIFGVLVAVISLNSILLIKLWALERELSIESIPDYESLR